MANKGPKNCARRCSAGAEMQKEQLRRHFKEDRAALSAQLREEYDRGIAEQLFALPAFQKARTVFCYLSTAQEVGTGLIVRQVLQQNKTLAVPRCISRGEMLFYSVSDTACLARGCFGIMEPDPSRCSPVTDFADSICITPALCYDKQGYRVGYGAGYYDRFFLSYTGAKVGIIYSRYIVEKIAHEPCDLPVDIVLSEKGIEYTGISR